MGIYRVYFYSNVRKENLIVEIEAESEDKAALAVRLCYRSIEINKVVKVEIPVIMMEDDYMLYAMSGVAHRLNSKLLAEYGGNSNGCRYKKIRKETESKNREYLNKIAKRRKKNKMKKRNRK